MDNQFIPIISTGFPMFVYGMLFVYVVMGFVVFCTMFLKILTQAYKIMFDVAIFDIIRAFVISLFWPVLIPYILYTEVDLN